jgi:phosphoribosyl 1,2-cyclic phosphodiesterase
MVLKFLSLASGSSGNCYYLGIDNYGILLDAGIGFRTIKKTLKAHQIGLEQIMAIFITHDHIDHIQSVGALVEKQKIPVYATPPVLAGINKSRVVSQSLHLSSKTIEKEQPVSIRDFTITAFEVPHDASDCVGYLVQYKNHNCVLATDVGHINDTAAQYIRRANHLIIEANYDKDMLLAGTYPVYLKNRITNGHGHLCNTETAEFLSANFDHHLKNIWLCHLSKDNNRPELAYKTVEKAFECNGIRIGVDVNLTTLQRNSSSGLFLLK